jgi:hypothetical protein
LAAHWSEANAVFAGIGSAEGKFAFGAAVLVDDAVIVIECLVNGNADALEVAGRSRLVIFTASQCECGSLSLQCLI